MHITLRNTLLPVLYLSFPFFVSAQADPSPNITISRIFARLTDVFNLIIPFLVLLATVIFIWGIVRYITAGGDEQRLTEAKNLIIWGIIALAVMLMMWGFVRILIDAIFGTENIPDIPGPDLAPFL